MSNYDDWNSRIQQWRDATHHVPSLVREDIVKGKYRPKMPAQGFRALMADPLDVQYSLGYKDRKYSLTYNVLKQTVQNLSILGAIVQTRTHQIASFSSPYRSTKSLGFVVKHKDPGRETTKSEREMIKDIEAFIYNCGAPKPNPHNGSTKRDDFETFLKKIVRDSLVYDQTAFEIVPDRKGQPYEFRAVDASSIRIAAPDPTIGPHNNWVERSPVFNTKYTHQLQPYSSLQTRTRGKERPAFVQVVNGQIEATFTHDTMAFGVRNPRSDIYIQGYGYSEIEQLITIITAHLYAEEYNRRFFMQGSAPKGLLNLKGDAMTPDQLEDFRREWRANLEGVENAWRTPILQSEQGVDWVNLNPTNKEMEYGQWMEYLIKVTCFTENMPVTLPDGSLKPIGLIAPGDLVLTHTGKPRKVKNVQKSTHTGDLYHIRAGETLEVTPEHPMYVASVTGTPHWIEAKDIVAGRDYLCIPKEGTPAESVPSYTHEDECFFFVPVSEVWTTEFDGEVYNLEVEDEHTYQVHRFAAHNCGVFLIDPAELNFDLSGGVQQTPLFESSSEWKLKASRDKGLRPLLRFIAKLINDNIVAKIDDHFVFDFVGLDELTENEKHELRKEQVASYMTLNEIRDAEDLPRVEGGDMILNPTYVQALQVRQQLAQAEQQQEEAAGAGAAGGAAPPGQAPPAAEEEAPAEDIPEYADSFTKSLSPILEISLDEDYDEWFEVCRGD